MKPRSLIFALVPLLLAGVPQMASACQICMGAQNSPAAAAVNNAIFIMFGVLGLIFTGIVSVFVSFYRRARKCSQEDGELAAMDREIKEASHHA